MNFRIKFLIYAASNFFAVKTKSKTGFFGYLVIAFFEKVDIAFFNSSNELIYLA